VGLNFSLPVDATTSKIIDENNFYHSELEQNNEYTHEKITLPLPLDLVVSPFPQHSTL